MSLLDEPEYERWRASADDAMGAADAQIRAGFDNWACFLCEQAAQLAIKGLLHGLGTGTFGHDLTKLGKALAAAANATLPAALNAALQRLSRHYIPTRYPDANPEGVPADHYSPEDGAQALADANEVLCAVDAAWRQLVAAEVGGADGS